MKVPHSFQNCPSPSGPLVRAQGGVLLEANLVVEPLEEPANVAAVAVGAEEEPGVSVRGERANLKMLQNKRLLAKIGFGRADNAPSKNFSQNLHDVD